MIYEANWDFTQNAYSQVKESCETSVLLNAKGEPRAGGGASKSTATKAPEPKAPEKPKAAPVKVCIKK